MKRETQRDERSGDMRPLLTKKGHLRAVTWLIEGREVYGRDSIALEELQWMVYGPSSWSRRVGEELINSIHALSLLCSRRVFNQRAAIPACDGIDVPGETKYALCAYAPQKYLNGYTTLLSIDLRCCFHYSSWSMSPTAPRSKQSRALLCPMPQFRLCFLTLIELS